MEKWIIDSKKIKIKNITVIETNDEEAKEILTNDQFCNCIEPIKNNIIIL